MLAIRKTVHGKLPSIQFEKIANELLGPNYDLSLVLCGDALSQRMNIDHRGKSYIPNVLSFSLNKYEGEIFLNPHVAAREARRFGVSYKSRLILLFAHGCLHLAGYRHSDKMERKEHSIALRYG